uniref:HNH endonuclease n=1 Tax=Herbidospora sakaeratensis TaxID=564415 RepID=UPI0007853602|nr:HNH endonuclease [Herbidospora sakaeratensis]
MELEEDPVSPIEAVLASVIKLNVQPSRDGSRKRHQPLTLLWAIGRAVRGEERMAEWPELKKAVAGLIRKFGKAGDAATPQYPFVALHNTRLWELSEPPPRDHHLTWLNSADPPIRGGFTRPLHDLFTRSRAAADLVVDQLLHDYFDDADEAALLGAVGLADVAAARRDFTGSLTYNAMVARRGEQAMLRRLLINGGARCALCGAELPETFLVAAHIKRRTDCEERERRDLDNVAMLACTLGCDSLYEHGYIKVSDGGLVELSPELVGHPRLHEHASRLAGRAVAAWSDSSRHYFAWHATNVFRTQARDEPRQDR